MYNPPYGSEGRVAMKVYNVIDESYTIWTLGSVKAAINFTKPALYNDREGNPLTEKDVRKSLRENRDVYLYGFDNDGDLKRDWDYKISVNNVISS